MNRPPLTATTKSSGVCVDDPLVRRGSLQRVEGAVELHAVHLRRDVLQLPALDQARGVEVTAPGRVAPSRHPDPHLRHAGSRAQPVGRPHARLDRRARPTRRQLSGRRRGRGPAGRRPRWRGRACRAAGPPARRCRRRRPAGRASRSTRSPREPGATVPWSSTEAASASRGVSACWGCHGLALVGAAVDGGRHRQPRVERGDRGVGAHRQRDAVVEHPAQREGPVAAVRPDLLGGVAVVEQVGGLDAGPDPELGHPAYVVAADQLGVLDRAADPGRGVRVEGLAHRRVADRVGGHLEVVGVGAGRAARAAPPGSGWARRRRTRRRTARSTRRCGC